MTPSSESTPISDTDRRDPPSPADALRDRLRDEALEILNARNVEGVKTAMLSYTTIQSIKAGDWGDVLDALDRLRRRAMLMLWIGVLAFPLGAVMHALLLVGMVSGGFETFSTLLFSLFWMGYGAYAVYENTRVLRSLERAHSLFHVLHDLDGQNPTPKTTHANP